MSTLTALAAKYGPKFTWIAIGEVGSAVVHAFAGRKSLCQTTRLPKNWLKLGREGAVCFGCSKALRDRETLKKLFFS